MTGNRCHSCGRGMLHPLQAKGNYGQDSLPPPTHSVWRTERHRLEVPTLTIISQIHPTSLDRNEASANPQSFAFPAFPGVDLKLAWFPVYISWQQAHRLGGGRFDPRARLSTASYGGPQLKEGTIGWVLVSVVVLSMALTIRRHPPTLAFHHLSFS